jgi:hypothetical protein
VCKGWFSNRKSLRYHLTHVENTALPPELGSQRDPDKSKRPPTRQAREQPARAPPSLEYLVCPESAMCETVKHVIRECPALKQQRQAMNNSLVDLRADFENAPGLNELAWYLDKDIFADVFIAFMDQAAQALPPELRCGPL